jgi:hypothetical protein
VVAVDQLLVAGELATSTEKRDRHDWAGTLVGGVAVASHSELDECGDHPMLAGRGQVVCGAGKRRRGPHQPAPAVGEDLHVESVAAMLAGVVEPG